MKQTLLVSALLLGLGLPAAADWLVVREGGRIETRGGWKVQGKMVVFTRADGTLSSLRLSEVDLPASEQATEAAKTAETAKAAAAADPAPKPQDEAPAKPRRVVTDKDLRPARPGVADGEVVAFPVRGHGELQLTIPRGWRSQIRPLSGDLPPTIDFSPSSDREAKLLVTILWSPTADPAFNSAERIRSLLPETSRKFVATSVEKQIRLNELRVPSGMGYWFSLTDGAPKPGEFKHMTQGAIPVGDLLLTFTALSHTPPPEAIQGALAVLATAVQRK